MLMFASADPALTFQSQPYPDAPPAKCPPKLHICLWVGGLPQPPFRLGFPGDVFKVMWGEDGYWFLGVPAADSGHSRPQESCSDVCPSPFL